MAKEVKNIGASVRAHKAEQAKEYLQLGLGTPELVFTRADGSPVKPDTFSNLFITHARKAGVPPISFHSLRHFHATHLLNQGVPVNVVAARLGHKSAKMTLDVYGHVNPDQEVAAAGKVDDSLRAVLEG